VPNLNPKQGISYLELERGRGEEREIDRYSKKDT